MNKRPAAYAPMLNELSISEFANAGVPIDSRNIGGKPSFAINHPSC